METFIYNLCIFILILYSVACGPTQPAIAENTPDPKDSSPEAYNVALLIMDGVYNTELTAPYDIFQHTIFREGIKPMRVFTVANTTEVITTFEGMRILPDYNYLEGDIPPIDILVVPSAEHHLDTDLEDEAMLNFVRKTSENAQFVTSHCDGAFVLAKTGILEGHASTTFPSDVDAYRQMFPQLEVHENVLFVHDGKFITSAGGAKSFEAALYLCEYLYGKQVAESLAQGLVIDWDLSTVPHLVVDADL
ncbi:DJ-1/PfpI family protein [Tunicatimonas pelagia]|uniref:DJ-1/PfpI family protein n=1 Tax=Tunicatimonas pelagia TaxID=931531 RepID=UPI0026671BB3|nr:DJ-1/PfpI family protein [Tunicatimonas pelagia]WKN45137.1 DJ-1/PfpI family protein [Tunicatimonas pelagia]